MCFVLNVLPQPASQTMYIKIYMCSLLVSDKNLVWLRGCIRQLRQILIGRLSVDNYVNKCYAVSLVNVSKSKYAYNNMSINIFACRWLSEYSSHIILCFIFIKSRSGVKYKTTSFCKKLPQQKCSLWSWKTIIRVF